MNTHQQRALWAAVLHQMADSIVNGDCDLPTRIDVWTQYVDESTFMDRADHTAAGPLEIKILGADYAGVTLPVGKLVELPIDWHIHMKITDDNRELFTRYAAEHNDICVGEGESYVAPNGDDDPDFVPAGLNDTSEN